MYITSAKVFTNITAKGAAAPSTGSSSHRPPLNGYKREHSMPDHFYIETSRRQNLTPMKNYSYQSNTVTGNDYSNPMEKSTGTLLSKHNGWITIDSDNSNRKQAPENY